MTNYFHYTNKCGLEGIKRDCKILESKNLDDGDDARFGTGVYLTTVPPSAGKKKIITTCWGPNSFPKLAINGRVDYVIHVKISPNQVEKATRKREVYLYKGNLDLTKYEWSDDEMPDED